MRWCGWRPIRRCRQRLRQTRGATAAQSAAAASTAAHEIAFVDTQVADYQRLVADLQRQADAGRPIEVHLLDAGQDGIRQITDTLQGRHDLTAVHVFSHGIDGAVELGSAWLNAYSLEARADSIAQWRACAGARRRPAALRLRRGRRCRRARPSSGGWPS